MAFHQLALSLLMRFLMLYRCGLPPMLGWVTPSPLSLFLKTSQVFLLVVFSIRTGIILGST